MILKTTASTIYISPFVDIRNGTLEAPSATGISIDRFSEYKLEGGYDEQWTGKGDDLTINAPNAAFMPMRSPGQKSSIRKQRMLYLTCLRLH